MLPLDISNYHQELLVFSVFFGFVISYLSLETVYWVSKKKNLMDDPEERSSHVTRIPTLGGVAVYLSILTTILCFGTFFNTNTMMMFLASISILLFLGLKDDLLVLSPRKKFLIQLFVGLLFIIITDIRVTSLFGLFQIHTLPYLHSIAFSLFVMILIINAVNMIDGIDGLAAGFGISATFSLSILHYFEDQIGLAVVGLSVVGALIAFLRLNLSKRRKMFMGDTGSMIVGFCMAALTINFLKASTVNDDSLFSVSAPVIALSILFFPLLDTFRVFMLRIFKYRTSPFKADRNHIHHYFLNYLQGHIKVSLLLITINLVIVMCSFFVTFLVIEYYLGLMIFIGVNLYLISFLLVKKFFNMSPDE